MARKSYFKKKKTTYRRRKRIYKKKASAQSQQAYVNEKLRIAVPIKLGGATSTNTRTVGIPIGQPAVGSGPLLQQPTFDMTTRWLALYKNYDQYAIKGLKVKFIPSNVGGQVTWDPNAPGGDYSTTCLLATRTWYNPDEFDARQYTNEQVVQLDAFRMYPPGKVIKRYFSNKGPSWRAKAKWQDCQDYNPINPLPNGLPNNSFTMRFQSQGMPAEYETEIGFLVCTWYVTFRGRTFNHP